MYTVQFARQSAGLVDKNIIVEACSAKFLVSFNCQSASKLLRVGLNVVCVSNSLDKTQIQAVCIRHYGCEWQAKG